MISGMLIGVLGFIFLSFTTNVWIFIAGIVIFSIGEMTAHPKYFSYVGLVAPADKKAVYMGYAFLYGVVGSLIGSNLGGTLYELMLKPLVGQQGIEQSIRIFWLIFAGLGLLAVIGLYAYNRKFSIESQETVALARLIMLGLYSLFFILGAWFLYSSMIGVDVQYKTLIQATIMLMIGGGGVIITKKNTKQSLGERNAKVL
jgi:MFS family permease